MKTAMTILMTIMLFLGSTSLAAAECAWVLWTSITRHLIKSADPAAQSWLAVNAYETEAACIAKRDIIFLEKSASWKMKTGVADFRINSAMPYFTYVDEGWRVLHRYLCLPDTIDPREKK